MLGVVLDRRHAAERVVGAQLVVIDHPPVRGSANIRESDEEALSSISSREVRLNSSIKSFWLRCRTGYDLTYDANGNLTSDGSRTYLWDDGDRLSEIKQAGTSIASFSYDALGRRVVKTENGTSTKYLYDGENAVQETQDTTANPILTGLGIDQRYGLNDTGGRSYFLTECWAARGC